MLFRRAANFGVRWLDTALHLLALEFWREVILPKSQESKAVSSHRTPDGSRIGKNLIFRLCRGERPLTTRIRHFFAQFRQVGDRIG